MPTLGAPDLSAAIGERGACIAQAALASYSPFVRGHFGVPEDRLVLCGISFGYEDQAHPANEFRTGRARLAKVVDWHA